jgi:formylglycine-generating enzyme required for sulfatase activity
MALLPGEVLNGRYRIVVPLGEGLYGAVYRGWDLVDGRDVAIKELLDEAPETRRLFQAGANKLRRLKHPQLPAVLDHFYLKNSGLYLISEYVDGVNLQTLLNEYGLLPSDLIINWLQSACEPLGYLHGKGQLHKNIKPANIRVTPAGEVFLVDVALPGLGLAPAETGYASPEQKTQDSVTVASDIYGLGATLYTLLTGKAPPDALHRESGLEELVPAREANPDVEPYLSVAASRAMDMRPEVRNESAAEFARALERPVGRVLPQEDTLRRTETGKTATPIPRPAGSRRRAIERRTIYGLLGALLLMVGIAIGITLASGVLGSSEDPIEATATLRSQIVAALTAITTVTATPAPSATPIPTPEPLVDEKTGMRMLFVPGGVFRMGNDDAEFDEAPSHLVRLDPYYIDQTEVTNSQYALCVEDEVCRPPDRPSATYHPAYYGDPGFDDYPVIFVSWNHARDFCNWRGARLPSEAEWEKAAGFDPLQAIKHTFPWGDIFDGTLLNYCDTNCPRADRDTDFDDGHTDTSPVASYAGGRSPIGLYDVSGNVMEWVGDWYDPDYYESSTDTNPLGPLDGEFKSLRGGSWLSGVDEVRVSGRSSFEPSVSRANLGFRCALTPP